MQELRDGRLVSPFGEEEFSVETTTYYVVRSTGFKNADLIVAFEKWLRGTLGAANLTTKR